MNMSTLLSTLVLFLGVAVLYFLWYEFDMWKMNFKANLEEKRKNGKK